MLKKEKIGKLLQRNIWLSIILILFLGQLVPISYFEFSQVSSESTWTLTTDEDFNNGTLDNTMIIGTGTEGTLRLELNDYNKWEEKPTSVEPSIRQGHAMAPIWGTDKVLIYGGENGNIREDTWVYDYGNNTWEEKIPTGNPGILTNHGMATIYGTDKVYMYGGTDGASALIETYIYDLSENTWTNVQHSLPRAGYGLATVYGTDRIVVYGGYNDNGEDIRNTRIYDVSEDMWYKKFPATRPPHRRWHSMAAVYNDDRIVMFGGYASASSESNNETWIYDYGANTWKQMFPQNSPSKRNKHSMVMIPYTDKVLLYDGSPKLRDTWIYDVGDNTWTELILSTKPTERVFHGMTNIWGTDKILFFGGKDSSNTYKDTWIFSPSISNSGGTYISAPYDTGTEARFKTINWYGVKSKGTSIKFQLKTAKTELKLDSKEFMGPNGSTNEFYKKTSTHIWTGHNGDRWIQVKAYLDIDNPTDSPVLENIIIMYNCVPKTSLESPANESLISDNTPKFEWNYFDIDSNEQTGFQILIDDDLYFDSIDFDSGIQTQKDQEWEFTKIGPYANQLSDGTWYWKIRTTDEDSDWSKYSEPWSFTLDSSRPVSAVTIPQNNEFLNTLKTISGTASDGVEGSGIKKVEIAIKRLNNHNFWSGKDWVKYDTWLNATGTKVWSYDASKIIWKSGIEYNIRSRATDNFNNLESPDKGTYINIDTEKPKSIIEFPNDNSFLKFLYRINGTAEDIGESDIQLVQVCIRRVSDDNYWSGSSWVTGEEWLDTIGTATWTFDTSEITWTTDKRYIIKSRALDNANNQELGSSETTFLIDDQPPNQLSISINNGDVYTNSISATISVSAQDKGTGVSQMAFSFDSIIWLSWEDYTETKLMDLEAFDGERTVYFKAIDNTGNIAEPVFDTIILDTTSPSKLLIEINNNSKYTNSKKVSLNLDANDTSSGIADMSFSFDKTNWTTWEEFKELKSITLPTGDGQKLVYFRVRDKLGNIAKFVSDSIKLDTEPPHSLSIQIDKGLPEIDTTSVYLYFEATDDLSGVSQMSISTDGVTWSPWEKYNTIKPFELPSGDGEKTVYFKVKDNVSNIADEVSASVILKTEEEKERESLAESSGFLMSLIIVVIIIILLIVIILVIKKRKKQSATEASTIDKTTKRTFAPGDKIEVKPEEQLPAQTPTGTRPTPTHATTPTPQPTPQTATQATSEPDSEAVEGEVCLTCSGQLYLIKGHDRFYCYNCKKFE